MNGFFWVQRRGKIVFIDLKGFKIMNSKSRIFVGVLGVTKKRRVR